MNNTQYVEKILNAADRILVDTSTLMTPGFLQFINNNRERFLPNNKRIIVIKAVYTEIARHLDSDNSEKSLHAMAAVELLAVNKNIFQIESEPLSDEEITHAFADAQILSDLTLHKSACNQLLITNDRKLSCDAFDINRQQSCLGRKVFVCYINGYGEMQCCECARSIPEQTVDDIAASPEDALHSPVEFAAKKIKPEAQERAWQFDWKSGLVGVSCACILYGLIKGGKAILRYVRR